MILVALTMFHSDFAIFKGVMPEIMPFGADGDLAALDHALHFGTEPRRIVQWIGEGLPSFVFGRIHIPLWFFVPLTTVIGILDCNSRRSEVYLAVYGASMVLPRHPWRSKITPEAVSTAAMI